MSRAPAGRIPDDVVTHPLDERPAVWVLVDGQRYAGREHARGADGRAALVAWSGASNGGEYAWLRAGDVEPRELD